MMILIANAITAWYDLKLAKYVLENTTSKREEFINFKSSLSNFQRCFRRTVKSKNADELLDEDVEKLIQA